MQCNSLCLLDENCYGYKWGEDNYICTLLEKDGLCLNEIEPNRIDAFVLESDMCGISCKGIYDVNGQCRRFKYLNHH